LIIQIISHAVHQSAKAANAAASAPTAASILLAGDELTVMTVELLATLVVACVVVVGAVVVDTGAKVLLLILTGTESEVMVVVIFAIVVTPLELELPPPAGLPPPFSQVHLLLELVGTPLVTTTVTVVGGGGGVVLLGTLEVLFTVEVVVTTAEVCVAVALYATQRAEPTLCAVTSSAALHEATRQRTASVPMAVCEGPHWQPWSPGAQPAARMAEERQPVWTGQL
jgi:hypothetical protein